MSSTVPFNGLFDVVSIVDLCVDSRCCPSPKIVDIPILGKFKGVFCTWSLMSFPCRAAKAVSYVGGVKADAAQELKLELVVLEVVTR